MVSQAFLNIQPGTNPIELAGQIISASVRTFLPGERKPRTIQPKPGIFSAEDIAKAKRILFLGAKIQRSERLTPQTGGKQRTGFMREIAALLGEGRQERQFVQAQQKAESDFLARIQGAISKQLGSFKVPQAPQAFQTPMIESESQVKQVEQSPTSLIPLAIIGAVLLG